MPKLNHKVQNQWQKSICLIAFKITSLVQKIKNGQINHSPNNIYTKGEDKP